MTLNLDDSIGKFWGAVKTLVVDRGSLGARLPKAYAHELGKIDPDILPESQRAAFMAVLKQLDGRKFSSLSDQETENIAREIFGILEVLVGREPSEQK
jgi:hypothetical protein